VERAVAAASALPDLDACSDVAQLEAQVPPPADKATGERVQALRARLAEASALDKGGKYAAALAIVREVVDAARPLGYLPLVGEAELARGNDLDRAGDAKGAEDAYYEAIYAADEGRDADTVANAWLELWWIAGVDRPSFADAARVERLADASIHRAGDA